MRTRLLKWFMVSVFALMTAATASASTTPPPGSPCPDPQVSCAVIPGIATSTADPHFVLPNDPGVVSLGIFVVPGDVVLFETSPGSLSDRTTWSDVVEFSDSPTGGGSIATTFPDAEPVGVLFPNPSLSFNAVGLPETLLGTGSDVTDFTTYTAGSATYDIYSDCAAPSCEIAEPRETPEPNSLLLFGTGLIGLAGIVKRKLLS